MKLPIISFGLNSHIWPNFRPIGCELSEKIPEKKKYRNRRVKHIPSPLLRSARQMQRDQLVHGWVPESS